MAQTDSTETSPAEGPRKRSSRRRRGQPKPPSTLLGRARALLRQKTVVRNTVSGIAVLGLMFVFVHWWNWADSIYSYMGAKLSDDQRAILYANGYPTAVRVDGQGPWIKTNLSSEGFVPGSTVPTVAGRDLFAYSQWSYALPLKAESQFTFLPGSGRVTRIACLQLQAVPGSCPAKLGVAVGDGDQVPYRKAGRPQRQQIIGSSKHLYYEKIGVEYTMAQRQVYRIDFTEPTGGVGTYWAYFFRSFIP
jgi:hypothetical protein